MPPNWCKHNIDNDDMKLFVLIYPIKCCLGGQYGARSHALLVGDASRPENSVVYCTAATLAREMAVRSDFGATAASKWLLGPAVVPPERSKWPVEPACAARAFEMTA